MAVLGVTRLLAAVLGVAGLAACAAPDRREPAPAPPRPPPPPTASATGRCRGRPAAGTPTPGSW
jgi:hypothetical protein